MSRKYGTVSDMKGPSQTTKEAHMIPVKVKSLKHLKNILAKGRGDFFIVLNYGCRSSKTLWYEHKEDVFSVINWIDDSEQQLSSKQMMDGKHTNIGEAIKKAALYYEGRAI